MKLLVSLLFWTLLLVILPKVYANPQFILDIPMGYPIEEITTPPNDDLERMRFEKHNKEAQSRREFKSMLLSAYSSNFKTSLIAYPDGSEGIRFTGNSEAIKAIAKDLLKIDGIQLVATEEATKAFLDEPTPQNVRKNPAAELLLVAIDQVLNETPKRHLKVVTESDCSRALELPNNNDLKK